MKKAKMNIYLNPLFVLFMILFCQCENNTESNKQSDFIFPNLGNIDSAVYNEIKKTCETYWDLSKMIDSTFAIIVDGDEYSVQCDGILDEVLYQFVIRVDKFGKWINDGRSIKESQT